MTYDTIVYGTYSPYLTGTALYWHTVCTFKIGPYQNTINYNYRNGGVVRSDLSGTALVRPEKNQKGVVPNPNEWQIDHIIPKRAGGTNSYSNAQVLSRYENRLKWFYFEQ